MKIKTADLLGLALNWAVAKCLGAAKIQPYEYNGQVFLRVYLDGCIHAPWEPSRYWNQGGPIIERVGINVTLRYGSLPPNHVHDVWDAVIKPEFYTSGRPESGVQKETLSSGPTPLVAAMRCFVASKLGNEVEVPDELTEKD